MAACWRQRNEAEAALTGRGRAGQGEKTALPGRLDVKAQSTPRRRDRSENKQAQIMITSGTPFSLEPLTAPADLYTQTNNQHLENCEQRTVDLG